MPNATTKLVIYLRLRNFYFESSLKVEIGIEYIYTIYLGSKLNTTVYVRRLILQSSSFFAKGGN